MRSIWGRMMEGTDFERGEVCSAEGCGSAPWGGKRADTGTEVIVG